MEISRYFINSNMERINTETEPTPVPGIDV